MSKLKASSKLKKKHNILIPSYTLIKQRPFLTHAFRVVRLLRKKKAGEELLPGVFVDILLEFYHRLGLVFRHPDRLQIARAQRKRKMVKTTKQEQNTAKIFSTGSWKRSMRRRIKTTNKINVQEEY